MAHGDYKKIGQSVLNINYRIYVNNTHLLQNLDSSEKNTTYW